MKFIIPIAMMAALATPATAQDFGNALLMGLGSSALDKGSDMLKEAPETFDKFLKETRSGRTYATEAACLGELQAGINAGAIMANMLPFSTVHSSEDTRGPVGHFRLMINGAKSRFDVHCDAARMVATIQPWGEVPEHAATNTRSSFDAAAGLLLLLHLQGAFEEEVPTPVARTDKEEVDVDALIADFKREREAEEALEAKPRAADDVIAAALADALGAPDEMPLTSGGSRPEPGSQPPLSSGESHGFAQAITPCWNIGALSREASRTAVVVSMQMNFDGTPVASSLRLIGSEGGSDAAARQAFEAAKRAIIRCGSRGYDLPSEKLAAGDTMVITFDPVRTASSAGVTVRQVRDR